MSNGGHSSADPPRPIILAAPNISEAMGGEASKALYLCRQLTRDGYRVIQIAHERCREEIDAAYPELDVRYLPDQPLQKLLFRLLGNTWLVDVLDVRALYRTARCIARTEGAALVHVASPISPVVPHYRVPEAPVLIGPLNGNIYHPAPFVHRMSRRKRLRRTLVPWLQRLLGMLFPGKRRADAILVSGGRRTRDALAQGGVAPERIVDTIDSGVSNSLAGYAAQGHEGRNPAFVFLGRLVEYKGCDLAVRAVARAAADVSLDVIGEGPERAALEALAAELGVAERVRFVGWMRHGPDLFDRLRRYRGFVFPTLAEANGIVFQEAMMLGLAVVTLNWGGPAELLDGDSAILIEPRSEEQVVAEIAAAMDRLAADAGLATRLSGAARARADRLGFTWERLADQWIGVYNRVLAGRGLPPVAPAAAGT